MKMKFTVPLKDVLDELAVNLCLLCPADTEKGVPPVEGIDLLDAGLPDDDLTAEVMCDYSPGEPPVMYQRNGDPGEPGYDAELELHSVACTTPLRLQYEGFALTIEAGTDLLPLLSGAGIEHMRDNLFPLAEQELDDAVEQALIERAEARNEELALA
ncbi:MAG: hypothetical protein ACXWVD_00540 [Telluria sp.]